MLVCFHGRKCVGGITWPKHAHAQISFGQLLVLFISTKERTEERKAEDKT